MRVFRLFALLPLSLAAPATARVTTPAPVIQPLGMQLIPGQYLVKLREDALKGSLDVFLGELRPTKPDFVYDSPYFVGFASSLDDATLETLQNNAEVEYIEQDAVVRNSAFVTESNAPWGLGRISHRKNASTDYSYDDSSGTNACAYIIDTGIYTSHPQFEGRALFVYNNIDTNNTDGNGHGTHVAGTIGSSSYGVAKKATLLAVKVLDENGTGTTSGVVAGMNFVSRDSQTRQCSKRSVANMSLGGSYSMSLNAAARALVRSGVFLAVAAGNDDEDASGTSPASEPTVCTVGASSEADSRAVFSNYGPLVDVFAPGVNILSTWIGGPSATNTVSGTSMATPHITGLAAYFLTLLGEKSPQSLCAYISNIATSGALSNVPVGTGNRLAFNGNPSG